MTGVTSYLHSRRTRRGPNKGWLLIIGLIVFFMISVWCFRSSSSEQTNDLTLVDVTSSQEVSVTIQPPATQDFQWETVSEVDLVDVVGGTGSGRATRETQSGFFHFVARATLSELSEDKYYEGWLVRLNPFDYFSVGDLIQNADGEWVVEWFGEFEKDYSDYRDVVITIETNDNDPSPAEHVLEGSFY